jgi:hypothetical protein
VIPLRSGGNATIRTLIARSASPVGGFPAEVQERAHQQKAASSLTSRLGVRHSGCRSAIINRCLLGKPQAMPIGQP